MSEISAGDQLLKVGIKLYSWEKLEEQQIISLKIIRTFLLSHIKTNNLDY